MVSPPLEGLEELKVSSLKTDDGMGWDAGLLRAIFEEKDSWMIQHITLSRSPCDDGWLWCHERSGAYTVKSSYRNQQGTRITKTSYHHRQLVGYERVGEGKDLHLACVLKFVANNASVIQEKVYPGNEISDISAEISAEIDKISPPKFRFSLIFPFVLWLQKMLLVGFEPTQNFWK